MLTVPPHSLLVLCGPAGCGKSSFARRYFRETEVVSSDRCRAFVADDEANQAISREAFILLRTLVRLRLRLKRLTVVDSTALQLRHRRSMVRLGRFFGASVIAVLFDISAETCKERNRRRGRRVPEDVIDLHREQFLTALETIFAEGFDAVYVIEDAERLKIEYAGAHL